MPIAGDLHGVPVPRPPLGARVGHQEHVPLLEAQQPGTIGLGGEGCPVGDQRGGGGGGGRRRRGGGEGEERGRRGGEQVCKSAVMMPLPHNFNLFCTKGS